MLPSVLACALLALAGCREAPREAVEQRHGEGRARTDEQGRVHISLAELGLADAQRFNTQPTLSFPFATRGDQVFTAATLQLRFADRIDPAWGVRGLDVLVNQEKMASLGPDAIHADLRGHPTATASVSIDPKALGDKNTLTFALAMDRPPTCGRVLSDAWNVLRDGELVLEAAPLPLPDELSLLPLPFVDRAFDRDAVIHVAFASQPSLATVRLAGMIASWFGIDAGAEARFPVSEGSLPDASTVVLIDSAESAAALGLAAPTGPAIEMLDHPRHPGGNVKLLVLSGRDAEELRRAVETLVDGSAGRFHGARAEVVEAPMPRVYAPYSSPRWMVADREIPFAHAFSPEQLTHVGMTGGKIALGFRLPPDLWVWPNEFIDLDLGYAITLPPGTPAPRLDLQLNGVFLTTLPPLDPARGENNRRLRLRVHRTVLHGFNELVVFVNYSAAEALCRSGETNEFRVQILADSTMRLGPFTRFAPQPDLRLFVNDGFPFTRLPDLSETAVVLSDVPRSEEISTLLSTLDHLATVTGVVARPSLLTAAEALAPEQAPKDLLVIGALENNSLLQRWRDRLPLLSGNGPAHVQTPSTLHPLLDLLAGRRGHEELERLSLMASGASRLVDVVGFESPLNARRSVVAITASTSAELPAFAAFSGPAQSARESGDLLVLLGGQRGLFEIGERYGTTQLHRFSSLRWFLSNHALILVPCLFLGVLGLALLLRGMVVRQIRARQWTDEQSAPIGDEPPADPLASGLEPQP